MRPGACVGGDPWSATSPNTPRKKLTFAKPRRKRPPGRKHPPTSITNDIMSCQFRTPPTTARLTFAKPRQRRPPAPTNDVSMPIPACHPSHPHLCKVQAEARAVLAHLRLRALRPRQQLHGEHPELVFDGGHLCRRRQHTHTDGRCATSRRAGWERGAAARGPAGTRRQLWPPAPAGEPPTPPLLPLWRNTSDAPCGPATAALCSPPFSGWGSCPR